MKLWSRKSRKDIFLTEKSIEFQVCMYHFGYSSLLTDCYCLAHLFVSIFFVVCFQILIFGCYEEELIISGLDLLSHPG